MADNVELQAACAALGYLDDDTYHKEPDCLETVKDLIRFLRRDSDYCEVRRQLGEAEIVCKDLLPIIKHYHDDRVLFDTVIRLLANLTQPARLCFHGHIPEEKTQRNFYMEIEGHLQSYKMAFADNILFAIFTKKLGDLLKLDWEHRQEEDRLLIERLLIVMRNILHIPPNVAAEMRTDDDASIHDQVVWALHVSGMEDLLLYIACSDDERQFAFHVLEIISLMFREQTAEQLAGVNNTRAASEKQQDERELAHLLERERCLKKMNVLKYSSRHSRFGGTFVVANMKSISDRNLIYHHSVGLANDIGFDRNKKPRKHPKNRRPITDPDFIRRSTPSIRLCLKEFCIQFLENCYNPLMHAVKDLLVRSKAQDSDETYYLWALRFFMEFNRRVDFRVALVSETLSLSTFHYVQVNLQTYLDMSLQNRKEALLWSRRMHLALKAYSELLNCVYAMDLSSDASVRSSAKVIKSNVFYTMEYRETFLLMLKHFDETRQSRSYLRDLIEATHLFLRMLEQFCKGNSHLIVQRRKKKGASKKNQKKKAPQQNAVEMSEADREAAWDEVNEELSSLLQGHGSVPNDVMPFDAASSVDIEQQRIDAVYKIQELLHNKQPGTALAFYRAAREVWPGRQEFGTEGMSAEDEFMALREICFTALPKSARSEQVDQPVDDAEVFPDEADPEIDEEEHAGMQMDFVEQEFSLPEFVLRFAQPQVVRAYVILLGDFSRNTPHTNHCAIKMLHRLAFDHQLAALLYQARLFRIFNRLLSDDAYRTATQYEEVRQFAKHILRKFFETLKTNDKVTVELFFWKTTKDAIEITEGYGSTQHTTSKVKQIWSEAQDDELKTLFNEFSEVNNNDRTTASGSDVVDYIMARMIDQTKTRRQVIRQLTHLDLIGGAKELKKKSGSARPRGWTEDQEVELRQLFDQFRESDDPVQEILSKLRNPRSKQKVVEKILELGLVQDKKELRRKRKSKTGSDGTRRKKKQEDEFVNDEDSDASSTGQRSPVSSDNDGSSSSSEDDDDAHPVKKAQPKKAPKTVEAKKQTKAKAASKPTVAHGNITHIRRAFTRAIGEGFSVAVTWLRNRLLRTAEDREEDDDDQPVPLVPLTEEQEDAMESSTFHELLQHCGLKPPANEQERYWRISAGLRPADLRRYASALEPAPPGGDSAAEHLDESSAAVPDNLSSRPSSPADETEQDVDAAERDVEADAAEDEDDQTRHEFLNRKNKAALSALIKKRQKMALKENATKMEDDRTVEEKSSSSQRSRLKRFVDSSESSDSDDEPKLVIDSSKIGSDEDDSESETPNRRVTKRARFVESESDGEHEPVDTERSRDESTTRRPFAVTSDDDDVSTPAKVAGGGRKRLAVESDSD